MGTYELNIILHYNLDQNKNKNKKTKQNREKNPTKTNKM